MILSDRSILKYVNRGDITISEFNEKNLGPNSYDVTLRDDIRIYDVRDPLTKVTVQNKISNTTKTIFCLDVTQKPQLVKIPKDEKDGVKGYFLYPDILYIAATNEVIGTDKFVQELHGRSSLARLGITIHDAGYGDVGFCGSWTLEITVIHPVFIVPNMRIGQIQFSEIDNPPLKLYKDKHTGAKYNNQDDPKGYHPDGELIRREELKRIYKDDTSI